MDYKFLQGSGFYFRELKQEDLQGNWYNWFNDGEVTLYQNKKYFPNSIEKQTEYYNYLLKSNQDVVFAIISDDDKNIHIGNVGLHKIDWIHRSAELGIVIGEKDYQGKKIGKNAWQLITNYGFQTLNLHRIYALIMENNLSSIKCAEGAGFSKEGFIKDYFFKEGLYNNVFYYNAINSK